MAKNSRWHAAASGHNKQPLGKAAAAAEIQQQSASRLLHSFCLPNTLLSGLPILSASAALM
jgi:hypothetical protein